MQLKQIIKETLIINDLKRTIEKESNYVPFQKLPYNQKLRISFISSGSTSYSIISRIALYFIV